MTTPADEAEYKLIRERAADWVCELQEDAPERQAAFAAWVRQSPRHIEEFLLAAAAWKALDGVGPTDDVEVEQAIARAIAATGMGAANVTALPEIRSIRAASLPTERTRRPERKPKIAAALAAAAVLGALGWWGFGGTGDRSSFETAAGEQRTVRLPDGSVLYLNTHSRATVRFSSAARDVRLLSGEALFVVAREAARPFRVLSGDAVIQAVGTQFNVRLGEDNTRVSVIEGRVKIPDSTVAPGSGSQLLAAGEEATISRNGQVTKRAAREVNDAVAWRERRLVFRGETLDNIAAEINRYNPKRRFTVEGDTLRQRRFAGTFSADDQDAVVSFLRQYDDMSVDILENKVVVRLKTAESPSAR